MRVVVPAANDTNNNDQHCNEKQQDPKQVDQSVVESEDRSCCRLLWLLLAASTRKKKALALPPSSTHSSTITGRKDSPDRKVVTTHPQSISLTVPTKQEECTSKCVPALPTISPPSSSPSSPPQSCPLSIYQYAIMFPRVIKLSMILSIALFAVLLLLTYCNTTSIATPNRLSQTRFYEDSLISMIRSKLDRRQAQVNQSPPPQTFRASVNQDQQPQGAPPEPTSNTWSNYQFAANEENDENEESGMNSENGEPQQTRPITIVETDPDKDILSGRDDRDMGQTRTFITTNMPPPPPPPQPFTTESSFSDAYEAELTTIHSSENNQEQAHQVRSRSSFPDDNKNRNNLKQMVLKYLVEKASSRREPIEEPANRQNMARAQSRTPYRSQRAQSFAPPRNNYNDPSSEYNRQTDMSRNAPGPNYGHRPPSMPTTNEEDEADDDNYEPPPLNIPHRNLSSPSQRIAQLFQDLNPEGNRISRYLLPAPLSGNSAPRCGDAVSIATNYELSSPNYPDKYPPNMDCVWEIRAQKDQNLRVQIFKLNVEQDKYCRFDFLDIKGVTQVDKRTKKLIKRTKRYCGTYVGEEIDIGSNTTTIAFHSDASNEMNGFHLRVIAESQDCIHTVHVHNSSYVTSPKFPESYDDSKNCWTLVTTEPDHRLLVEFEVLRLEPDSRCSLDYVEIFDSRFADSDKSLGRFCTFPDNASLSLYSTQPHLLFHFESDNFLALLGYKARITSLRKDVDMRSYTSCNWSADWQNMTITSPFYPKPYPAGTQCETSISSFLPDERIIILFDWIDLVDEVLQRKNTASNLRDQGSSTTNGTSSTATFKFNCSHDRLEIWESANDTEPSNVFCGYRSQPFKYVSNGNSIRLVFKSAQESAEELTNPKDRRRTSDPSNPNNPGFRARFTFIGSNSIQLSTSKTKTDFNLINSSNAFDKSSTNSNDQTSSSTAPTVQPKLIRRPENASVMLGSSHVLHCEVDPASKGRIQIIWFKGDREIHDGASQDGTSLLIHQFRPQSVGRYICVYGDNSTDAWLTLREETDKCKSSSVLFRERPRDQFTSEGEFMMLHCSVTMANRDGSEEDTAAKITWERIPLHYTEDRPLSPQPVEYNSRIKVLRRGDLLFDPAVVEDSGFYYCVARPNDQSQDLMTRPMNQSTREEQSNSNELCAIKSAARVQINQRVDVNAYCGRSFIQRKGEPAKTLMSDVGKIIGGTEAEPGEFPWMVMFWDEKRHVFCGGALLNERWVITAAHCFTDIADESTVFVKLGKYDQTAPETSEIVTKIQQINKHPQFSNETFDNDIALVKLVQHITFTDYIAPICMPSSTEEVEAMNTFFFESPDIVPQQSGQQSHSNPNPIQDPETKFGYVSGWGRLKENGPLPRYLHKIRLPIVEDNRCHRSTSFKVTDNMFCAGYGKEIVGDACKGDSGGPFAVEFNNRWTLLGIVSWGEGCGRPEKYGYYTKVNKYGNWIRRLTRHTY